MRVSVRVSRVAKAIDQCLLLYVNNNKFFNKKGNTDHIQAASFSKRLSLGRGLPVIRNKIKLAGSIIIAINRQDSISLPHPH